MQQRMVWVKPGDFRYHQVWLELPEEICEGEKTFDTSRVHVGFPALVTQIKEDQTCDCGATEHGDADFADLIHKKPDIGFRIPKGSNTFFKRLNSCRVAAAK